MAQHLLFTLPPPAAYVDPTEPNVLIYWDDVTQAIVTYNSDGLQYTGPRLGEISLYYFCEGDTLNQFRIITHFPHALRIQTEDSPVCIVVCDVYIESPMLVRNASNGATDGSVYVRAKSSASGLQYSLDETTWQASPFFNNLAPGTYTVYVKDNRNCTAEKEFEVLEEPGFGVRFTTSYKDSLGTTTRIDILKRDYSGASETVDAGDNPLVIKEVADNMFEPLRGQECTITFLAKQNEQFAELFTGDDREFRVDVFKGSNLFWRGWLVADVYTEPYLAPPFEVMFSATDGIGSLKNIPIYDGIPEGFAPQWEVLYFILNKLNTSLTLRSGINVYELRMNSGETEEPMRQAVISLDAYHDGKKAWDCAAILSAILKPYGAFLRQYFGSWHLIRVEEQRFDYVRRYYDYKGVFDYHDNFNPTTSITQANGSDSSKLYWTDRSQSVELRPGYRKSEVYFDYGFRENLIQGGYMQESDFYVHDEGTPWQEYRHKYFVGEFSATRKLTDIKKKEYSMLIYGSADEPEFTQNIETRRVWVSRDGGNVGVRIAFKFKLNGIGPIVSPNPEFAFSVRVNNKYLTYDADNNPVWLADDNFITPNDEFILTPANGFNSWQECEYFAEDIPEDGWLVVRLYDPIAHENYVTGALVREAVLQLYNGGTFDLAMDETFTADNPKTFFYEPETVVPAHGEVVPLKNAALIYKNLILVNGYASEDWKRRGLSEATPILEILNNTIMALNSKPVKLLRGALKGFFPWDTVLQDKVKKTRFMPLSFEYHDRRNIINGEFMELLGTTVITTGGGTLEHAEQEYNELEYN